MSTIFLLYRNQKDRLRLDTMIRMSHIAHGEQLPKDLTKVKTVVQWGVRGISERSEFNGRITWLNEESMLQRMQSSEFQALLKINGMCVIDDWHGKIAFPSQPYRVFVYGLRTIHLYKGMQSLEWEMGNRIHRLLRREAVKAVYVAGLDFAEVVIHVHGDRLLIERIDPTPFITEQVAKKWAEALRNESNMINGNEVKSSAPILIGTDLELLLCNENGRVVFASHFVKRKGRIGCDGIRLRDRRFIFPLLELRPEPKQDPRQLIEEIYKMMQLTKRKIKDPHLRWHSGGMPVPGFALGGHLHFGNVTCSSSILRVLDNYLALPFALIEGENEIKRRPGYGFLGDFREKEYGFEYRTLPSWLESPKLAYSVCSLAHYLIVHHRNLHQRPLQHLAVQQSFYRGDKMRLYKHGKKIIGELVRLSSFKPYLKAVQPFFRRALALKTMDSSLDIRRNWRLLS